MGRRTGPFSLYCFGCLVNLGAVRANPGTSGVKFSVCHAGQYTTSAFDFLFGEPTCMKRPKRRKWWYIILALAIKAIRPMGPRGQVVSLAFSLGSFDYMFPPLSHHARVCPKLEPQLHRWYGFLRQLQPQLPGERNNIGNRGQPCFASTAEWGSRWLAVEIERHLRVRLHALGDSDEVWRYAVFGQGKEEEEEVARNQVHCLFRVYEQH